MGFTITEVIRDLIFYIVPGYLAIKIRERFYTEKQSKSLDKVLDCILYSVIVRTIFPVIAFLLSKLSMPLYFFLFERTPMQIAYLLLSILLGIIIGKGNKWIANKNKKP